MNYAHPELLGDEADSSVALWNEHYKQSKWRLDELEYARNRHAKEQKPKGLMLLKLDDTKLPIRFVDTLWLVGEDRGKRELAIYKLLKSEI